MAQERPITPEKQLLSLIEGQGSRNPSQLQAQAIKHRGVGLFAPDAWTGRSAFLKAKFKKWFWDLRHAQLNIKAANHILGFLVAVLLVYFASDSLLSALRLRKAPKIEFSPAASGNLKEMQGAIGIKRAATYYLEKVRQRDIFSMNQKRSGVVEAASSRGPSSLIMQATEHLRLVGISWSEDPDAMVEDTRALRTFFVKRGQMIGEVKVQAIFKDKVVLSYAGEEVELK